MKQYTEFSAACLQVLLFNICVITFMPKRKVWHSMDQFTLNSTATCEDTTLNFSQKRGKNVQTGAQIKRDGDTGQKVL
jgi:hypothetical protein